MASAVAGERALEIRAAPDDEERTMENTMTQHTQARRSGRAAKLFAGAMSALLFTGAGALGCTQSVLLDVPVDVESPVQPPTGSSATATIDATGGEVRLGDLVLSIPAGAVAVATPITIRIDADPGLTPPTGFRTLSPMYRFEPDGLTFAAPVRIDLPFSGNGELATIFWTQPGSASTYSALPTTTLDFHARTEITHFSAGFVGTTSGCTDGNCCRRATGQLDLLFVVDNSGSMAEEQASLAEQLPRLVRAVVTGDTNGDGVQDFPAVADLHVGVVTVDMGVGGFSVPTCMTSPMYGDDGLLRTAGSTAIAGCLATYPNFLAYEAGSTVTPEQLAADFGCVASAGVYGCGFEQQLEAGLKALTPSASTTTFFGGTRGHGDAENAGFLRADATLAVVTVTDEEDCSIAVGSEAIFDQSPESPYPGDLNLRCFLYPDTQNAVARYVDGLLALKSDPSLLVFAPIVGVPMELVDTGASYDAMLADERMVQVIDTTPGTPGTRLIPSCNVTGVGIAFPPRRIVTVARDLAARGARAPVASICQESFEAPITAVLDAVQGSLSGTCH
jgi:hypothetical protein